jgi:hypothetical protein
MTRFYTIDSANERLDDVRGLLERLRDQRAELIELRDRAADRQRARTGSAGAGEADEDLAARDPELRAIRLRMQGLIDQMQAAVVQLDGWDVVLRDIKSGLIDFPALVAGRQVWLCWRLGEGPIEWWHELDAGFGGRQALIELR